MKLFKIHIAMKKTFIIRARNINDALCMLSKAYVFPSEAIVHCEELTLDGEKGIVMSCNL